MTVCDSSASSSAYQLPLSGAQLHDETDLLHSIELIRPPPHHTHALLPEFGGVGVGAADFIRFLMGKLTLDRIRVPFAAFVQQR